MGIHNSNSPNFCHSYESRGRDFKQQSFQRKPTKFNASDAARNPQRCFNCNDIGHLSKSCPNHSRGPRCLSCNLYGHKSFECRRANLNNTSTPPSGVNAVHELPSPINMCKDVTIFGRKLDGLVDTGSNLTLLKNSTYINIDAPPLKQTNTLLTGFGFSRINVIGTFDSEITIDDQIFPVTISVVPNSCTNYDLIIGCDVIKQAHLNISPTGVKFAQILRPSDNANENFIMTISDGSPTFDIGPNVSQHNRAEVEQLLSTYTPKKTKTVNIELDIALTDDEPIFHKPRRLPFAERDIVDAQVDEWVKNGIVEPCSSPYPSQVVVVKKKDGKSRVCIDYRRLNRKLIKDNNPLPLIDDILDCLQNAKIFITLDLKNGFFHVTVNERSRKFTSFVTHNGQYQFRRMSFGLSTCPSTFMRYINALFRHLISKSIVLPYMDDIVIPAANESQALEYLKIVLQVACDYGLEINFKKCQFLHNKIEFLGHIIENGRLFPSPSKTKAVINYPDLKNIKDVHRFLGLTGYFRKFLPSYSTIAKPLSDLLRKDSLFQFYAEQQTAFQKLKYLVSQKPVLSIFNQNSPTEIHTDASIDGLGAVLLQNSIHDNQFHPVFYMSKKTSDL
ncbi:retrovirus-related Pol polyprotein from transposon 297 [Trichonephila clavipes]|nr:retrovirus-related Pol polyprotein from transposon 297 [Trichonephila clavipes]